MTDFQPSPAPAGVCEHGYDAECPVCAWFSLTPDYRVALMREKGLVPPSERPQGFVARIVRWLGV